MGERVVNTAITNTVTKGKQKQDPRVPPPRKFPPPHGGQHPIDIHINNPAPNTSQESNMVATAPTNHDTTSSSNQCKKCTAKRPALSKGNFGLGSKNQELNHRRRQAKKNEFFQHTSIRGSDEARTIALVRFSSQKKKNSSNSRYLEGSPRADE
jgi:hypothetical protein